MYESFLFYGSWRETLEGFREDFGDEYAKEALWNLMTVATGGDIETSKKSILGFLNGTVIPLIDNSKGRYEGAVDNGKKGGRPSKDIDIDKVKELRAAGQSWDRVAAYMSTIGPKISGEGLRKKMKKLEDEQLATYQQTNNQQPTYQQTNQLTKQLTFNNNNKSNNSNINNIASCCEDSLGFYKY